MLIDCQLHWKGLTRSDGTGDLRLEVLHRIQVGEIDPAVVGWRGVVSILLHVEHVQDDIHTIEPLKEYNDLDSKDMQQSAKFFKPD